MDPIFFSSKFNATIAQWRNAYSKCEDVGWNVDRLKKMVKKNSWRMEAENIAQWWKHARDENVNQELLEMMRNVQIAELDSIRDKINEGGKPFCVTTLFPFLDWSVFAIEEKVGKYITKRFKTMMKWPDSYLVSSFGQLIQSGKILYLKSIFTKDEKEQMTGLIFQWIICSSVQRSKNDKIEELWVLHDLMGTNEMKDQFEASIKLLKKLQLNLSYPTDKRFRARENIVVLSEFLAVEIVLNEIIPDIPKQEVIDPNNGFTNQAFRDYPKQKASTETFNMDPDEDNDVKLVDVELHKRFVAQKYAV